MKSKELYPLFILLFLALIWGSSFILIKKGLLAYSAIQVAALRIVFAWIALLPLALRNLNPIFKEKWLQLFILGLIANLGPAILFSIAETGISSSLAGMLNSLTPVFTIIVGILFYRVKINMPLSIGLTFGLIGSIILSLVGSTGGLGSFNIYAAYVILATLLYGIAGNITKQYVTIIKPIVLVSLTMFAVGPFALIILLFTDYFHVSFTHPDALISVSSVFVLGTIGTALALVLFNILIKKTSAVFASSVTYLIPIAAIGWGFIDGEILFPLHFIGMSIVIIGIFLINKYK